MSRDDEKSDLHGQESPDPNEPVPGSEVSKATERERQFLRQRFAVIRRRDDERGGQEHDLIGQDPSGGTLRERDSSSSKGPLISPFRPDFRLQLIEQYRMRQESLYVASENTFVPIGPAVVRKGQASNRPAVTGRIAGIALTTDASRVYVASAMGGVWRSEDQGRTWRSLMEASDWDPTAWSSPTLACGAIAVSPTDPDRVYVGTGEGGDSILREGGDSLASYFGAGPIRTDDGGRNWFREPTASGSPTLAGKGFFKLAVDPADPERVVAATEEGIYRREPADVGPDPYPGSSGYHWVQKRTRRHSSVVVAASAPGTTFYAAQYGEGVYRSADGDVWTPMSAGFPTAGVGRIGLAVCPTDPSVVYALVAKDDPAVLLGVWRFDTGDTSEAKWRPVSGAPPGLFRPAQGWYDMDMVVDPNDVNRIYLGGSSQSAGGVASGNIHRCVVSSSGSGDSLSYTMVPTFIGRTTHADVHALVFTPGSADELWAGTDGGLFYTSDATGSARFESRNVGLATLLMERLAMHPTEDGILFAGTQDNGTLRWTGEECWLGAGRGDCGYCVVNWNNPYKVLRQSLYTTVERAEDGAQGYGPGPSSWTDVSIPGVDPLRPDLSAEFYAPLATTPKNLAAPAEAEIVAFGGIRPWISTTFGGNWQAITPHDLPSMIRSLVFSSASRLYAGTFGGQVYRFDRSGESWSETALHAAPLPVLPITHIAVDPADKTGRSIYVTLGGAGTSQRVWRYNGKVWEARSGTGETGLLDVYHSVVVVDPVYPSHLYAGADVGVWRSTDSGMSWQCWAHGLPDAPVMDLKLHGQRRLLWAATHGRGVHERRLDVPVAPPVELYLRDTQLDLGRRPTVNWLPDPTQPGQVVRHWAGPGIKVDVPSAAGDYQTPTNRIDCFQYLDTIVDASQGTNTADPSTATVVNRVYVQVHNRGVDAANNVRVMLLLTDASPGLPNLPLGYEASLRAESPIPINTPVWTTVGFANLDDVRVGLPGVAAFDLPSTMLPPPADLPAREHHCLLALVHCPTNDEFTNTETRVDILSPTERKAAHKNLKVVPFTPASTSLRWESFSLFGILDKPWDYDLAAELPRYPGRFRLMVPPDLVLVGRGGKPPTGFQVEDTKEFDEWSERQLRNLDLWIEQKRFDPARCERMAKAIMKLKGQPMLVVPEGADRASIRVRLGPDDAHLLFFAIDPPRNAQVGDVFDLQVQLFALGYNVEEVGQLSPGCVFRVAVMPEADQEDEIRLRIWGRQGTRSETAYVRVLDRAGQTLTPADGVQAGAYVHSRIGVHKGYCPMRFDARAKAFALSVEDLPHRAAGTVKLTVVATANRRRGCRTEELRLG